MSRPHRYEPAINRTYAGSRSTMTWPSSLPAPPVPGIKPKSRWACRWWSAGSRRGPPPHLLLPPGAKHRDYQPAGGSQPAPFQKTPGSRQSVFESLDRPALRPLPAQPYEYAEWKLVRVNIDYHVEVDGHHYSVPYALVKQQLEARLSAQVVEIFHKGRRGQSPTVAPQGRHSTVAAHMPKAHQHAEWTPQRLILWAAKTGEATAQVVEAILTSRPHPQQGFRACLGIMRLGKHYGDGRLEAACHRAIRIGACSYTSIESILKHALDQQPLPGPPTAAP